MAFGNYNPYRVPVYLEASTKEVLIKLMVVIQQVNGVNYNFQTPYQSGDKWVVWFFEDTRDFKPIKEEDLEGLITVLGRVDAFSTQ